MKSPILRKSLAILLAFCLCLPIVAGYTVSAQQTEGSKVLSINFSRISENNANLITKQAYPGGSTFSFDAYVPAGGGSWWGVLWTTDTSVGDIYNHSSGHIFNAVADQWANYSWTLPDDGQNYYMYFVGEITPAWADKPVLIDNFTVCDSYDNVIAFDGFNTILNAGLFYANSGAVSLIDYDYHAVINVDGLNSTDNTAMSLITKEAYPGGSTITFDAFVPSGASWWGLCWTTDPSVASIYNVFSTGCRMTTQDDTWATYTATLPNDGNNYYIYLGAAVGEWGGKTIALNNVKISKNATVLATDGFDNGPYNSVFDYDNAVSVVGGEVEVTNIYAAINIDNICSDDNNPMSFITKEAYSGGSTVSFDAYIPSGTSWWGLCWTTDPSVTSIYNCWSLGTTFSTQNDTWATYTATLPDDGNDYYFYFVGAVGEWNGKEMLVDNVVVNSSSNVTLAAEDFSDGLGNSIFYYVKTKAETLPVVTQKSNSESTADYVASVDVDAICSADNNPMSFITENAYPGGSTVSFDAYIPSGASWWGLCWTTDPNVASIYNCWSLGRTFSTQNDTWATYTATLPDDGNDYYFYFVGAVGEWNGKEILVDNVTVTGTNGYTLGEDDFSNGLDNGMFVTDSAISLVDITPEEPVETVCGDINADDIVDVVDLVILKKYLADARALDANGLAAADIDVDGEIDADDVVAVKSIILLGTVYSGGITFTAYAAPTVNGTVQASDETALDSAYAKLSEAGFGKAIALYEGCSAKSGDNLYNIIQNRSAVVEEAAAVALNIAERYNVKYYVKDWSLYDLGGEACDDLGFDSDEVNTEAQVKTIIENMFSAQNPYVNHSAYAGNFGFDEPFIGDMTMLTYQAKYYYQQMQARGSDGELLINLLPAYVGENSQALGYQTWLERLTGNTDKTYSNYVDTYLSQVAPYTGYISWDYYPFMANDNAGKTERERNYLANLELIAQKCKANNIELRTFIQATGDSTGMRAINGPEDLSLQIYAGMAFGVREFMYYCYSSNDASDGNCLFNNATQTYTDVYDAAKTVNNEVLKLGSIYNKYKWDAVMANNVNNNQMLAGLGNAVASHNGTSIASSTGDVLCGAFVAKDSSKKNQNAYVFVNVTDLASTAANTVTVNLPTGTTSVALYRNGERTVTAVSGSAFSFSLAAGEGVFVIPQQ